MRPPLAAVLFAAGFIEPGLTELKPGCTACQKSPHRTFLTALSAEHFESVQNAVTESLDISRLSTAVYPI